MDNGYEQPQQPQQQFDQSQQQQMQCDPVHAAANGFPTTLPIGVAIPLPPPPSATDIDSLLLQQFSCMCTTDHEDLIKQFQSIMNNQMSGDAAKFFLEMSNWNLQAAVGCYLDYCNFQNIPSMKILIESTPVGFRHGWRIQNDGTEDWPNGCYLKTPNRTTRFNIPVLKPGETCDITVDKPHAKPEMWRLCTPNGWYFGEPIWMQLPPDACDLHNDLVDRMANLDTNETPERESQVNIFKSKHVH